SGTTSACDGDTGPYKVSDAGHFLNSFFQTAHGVSLRLGPGAIAIQLHGQSSKRVVAETSDGTKASELRTWLSNSLRLALSQRGVSVASGNWSADHPESLNRCGTDNVQGRQTNASADICNRDASAGTGRFLHLEQKLSLRDDPTALIAALKQVLPPNGPGA